MTKPERKNKKKLLTMDHKTLLFWLLTSNLFSNKKIIHKKDAVRPRLSQKGSSSAMRNLIVFGGFVYLNQDGMLLCANAIAPESKNLNMLVFDPPSRCPEGLQTKLKGRWAEARLPSVITVVYFTRVQGGVCVSSCNS